MIAAAREPRHAPLEERLLWIDPRARRIGSTGFDALPRLLRRGDLLVVNDSATVPASLRAHTETGLAIELRLVGRAEDATWSAALFGDGDWRTPTEDRAPPPVLAEGASVFLQAGLQARITAVAPETPRLVKLRFLASDDVLWAALYGSGKPVQYSYLSRELRLAEVQTPFSARPWSVEMPSAGRGLSWSLLLALRSAGVELAALTHAAGLSSIGDAGLDRLLPLPEPYELPHRTVQAIEAAKRRAGRVIAAGTTVVRALEGAHAEHGALRPGRGVTSLRIDRHHVPRVCDGILSGVHEPGSSHHDLLGAFAGEALLLAAHAEASRLGYLAHEFGDHTLVLAGL